MEKLPRSRKKNFVDRRKQEVNISQNKRENKNRREEQERRKIDKEIELDLRKNERRYVEFEDYTPLMLKQRREWLANQCNVNLDNIGSFSINPQEYRGNIERMIGVAQIPMGIAGPILMDGEYAKGEFWIPMATTEASLVNTFTWGMQAIGLSGGVKARVLKDKTHIAPIFLMDSLDESIKFQEWIRENFDNIKQQAETTTNYGKLISIDTRILANKVITIFNYTTGDAAGQNMIAIATDIACKYIQKKTGYKFYLKSNFCSDKKVSFYNYLEGYGKSVQAEVVIPKKVVSKVLKTTLEDVVYYYNNVVILSSNYAGMFGGVNGHIANGLAAVYLACGQDMAHVANSFVGSAHYEYTKDNNLHAFISLPSLIVATVGGGLKSGTTKEALKVINCYGKNRVQKFTEIIAGVVLAGEIAIISSIVNGTFAEGHKKYRSK